MNTLKIFEKYLINARLEFEKLNNPIERIEIKDRGGKAFAVVFSDFTTEEDKLAVMIEKAPVQTGLTADEVFSIISGRYL